MQNDNHAANIEPPHAAQGTPVADKETKPDDQLSTEDDVQESVIDKDKVKNVPMVKIFQQEEYKLVNRPMTPMSYDIMARPPIKGLVNVVVEQPVELVIDDAHDKAAADASVSQPVGPLRRRRFIFIGDVHGQRKPLDDLLEKVDFEVGHDHLIFTGDLINKGPDSPGVVQLAMDLGASAVRGNHEDRVLLAYNRLHPNRHSPPAVDVPHVSSEGALGEGPKTRPLPEAIEAEGKRERAAAMLEREAELLEEEAGESSGLLSLLGLQKHPRKGEDRIDHDRMVAELQSDPLEQNPFSHGDAVEVAVASALTPAQARWLSELPVILHLGRIAPPTAAVSPAATEANTNAPFNDVVVVHAGLVPDVPLERQDPYAVMVMRSLVYPADEERRQRARMIAEARIRMEARGRIKPSDQVNVPGGRIDTEFKKLQKKAYGPELHHPRQPSPPGAPRQPGQGDPDPADLVMLPIEGHFRGHNDRVHWAAAWNQAQHAIPTPENRTTVIYGHDAVTGLLVPEKLSSGLFRMLGTVSTGSRAGSVVTEADMGYTFGLDSGAVYGGKLTALIVEADADGRVQHRIKQVPCPKAVERKAS